SELRVVPAFGESHRYQGLVTGFALAILPSEGKDEALRLDNLAVDALLPMVGALGRAHADAKGPARPDIHIAISRHEALWSPPARCAIGLCPRLKHEMARRIEDPCDDQFPLSPGRLNACRR